MEKLTKDQEIEYWKAKAEAYQSHYLHLQTINRSLQEDADRYYAVRNSPAVVVYIEDQPYFEGRLDNKLDGIYETLLDEEEDY